MYSEQDLFNRFANLQAVQIQDKKYSVTAFENVIKLKHKNHTVLLGKSSLHERYALIGGILHYKQKNLVTGNETNINAEIN